MTSDVYAYIVNKNYFYGFYPACYSVAGRYLCNNDDLLNVRHLSLSVTMNAESVRNVVQPKTKTNAIKSVKIQ